jgi:hypothetical protein
LVKFLGTRFDTAGEFVVAVCLVAHVAIFAIGSVLGVVLTPAAVTVLLCISAPILLGLPGSLLLGLVFLALLWLVLENETTELETQVYIRTLTTGFAIKENASILDHYVGFGILAFLAENEFVYEAIEVILQLGGLVGTVDDPTIVSRVRIGLSSEFETEIFDYVCSGACQGLGDAAEVDNYCFDTVALAFNLRLESLHLVSIEGILHIAANIDGRHFCGELGDNFEFASYGSGHDFDRYATG